MKKWIISLFVLLLLATTVSAADPMVWTDKDDYNPLETVLISGINFRPNTAFNLLVYRPDGGTDYIPVVTDGAGSFTNVPYLLTPERAFEGDYGIKANDGVNEAFALFTDCSICDRLLTAECDEQTGELIIIGRMCFLPITVKFIPDSGTPVENSGWGWVSLIIEEPTPGYAELWFCGVLIKSIRVPECGIPTAPEFGLSGVLAAVALSLAIYAVVRTKKK